MNDETNTTNLVNDPAIHYSAESEISNPLNLIRGMLADFSAGRELAARLFVRNLRGLYRQTLLGLPGHVASIGDVDVLNEQGEIQEEFETGETVRVRIRLDSHERIKNARLIVALRSAVHGVLCSVSTPYQDVKFDVPSGGCTVSISFPKIPLMIGAYHFNISLYGPETIDFYHRGSLRGNFRIVGPPTDANGYEILGTVKLDHQWQIDG